MILITGDTGWGGSVGADGSLEAVYEGARTRATEEHLTNRVLVAHVSTCRREEMPYAADRGSEFYKNHLCLHGLACAIEAFRPSVVLLSEVGEEFRHVRGRLLRILRAVHASVKCDFHWGQMSQRVRYPIG